MSANPQSAPLGKPHQVGPSSASPVPSFPRSEHRDLETLLALSSLHEQIRTRKTQELNKGARLTPEDAWELTQLVHDEVLQLVVDRALMITGADGVAVALVDGSGIVCRACAGEIAPEIGTRLDPYSGFSGACLRTGEIVRCDDSENDSRVSREACRRLQTRSMVAIPLASPHAILGVLEAFSTEPMGFNDSDVRSLSLLSELILDAMKPEEEDRLAEVSQQVVRAIYPPAPQADTRDDSRISFQDKGAAPLPPDLRPMNFYAWRELEASKHKTKLVFFSDTEPATEARPGLKLVIVLVVLAIFMGAGLWWQIRRAVAPKIRQRPVRESLQNPPVVPPPVRSEDAAGSAPQIEALGTLQSQGSADRNLTPEITGIRHWSSENSSSVVIDLQDQVQYEAHRLTKPERIYFDLMDTKLAPGLLGKTIEVNDPVLQRIRIAQPKQGVTRVVLDTRGASNYSVSMEQNPFRLMVEVGKLGTKVGPSARLNLFKSGESGQTAGSSTVMRLPIPAIPVVAGIPKAKLQLSSPPVVPPLGPSIVLDAGHGGWDLGTVGRKGLEEKDLVLDIVQRLGSLLEQRLNAKITYTRQDDSYVALERRAEIANLSQAELFVSIHANYSDLVSARGVETYYTNTYSSMKARPPGTGLEKPLQNIDWTKINIREKVQGSHHLAECVQQALFGTVVAKNPGIRNRGVKEAQYVVLTGTSMPAILAEVSFVSSPTDESELQNDAYRQRIAEALYKGIAHYQQAQRRTTIATLLSKPTLR